MSDRATNKPAISSCYPRYVGGGGERLGAALRAHADASASLFAQAVLSELLGRGREPPYLFVIHGPQESGESYTSGVLEFSAPPGRVFAPYWLMQELSIEEGDTIPVAACESVRCSAGLAEATRSVR